MMFVWMWQLCEREGRLHRLLFFSLVTRFGAPQTDGQKNTLIKNAGLNVCPGLVV